MKIFLEKAIFVNRAPFDKLELDFSENEIAVLSAVNGRGKTTILSHIVDAFYEMAKPYFQNEFEDKKNKFYRVSSYIYNLKKKEPSFVYLRFKTPDGNIDYLDIRNGTEEQYNCTEEQYNQAVTLENKILFSEVSASLKENSCIKFPKILVKTDKESIKEAFHNNLLTYFPSYRYEMPGYLNDPYKIKLDFKKEGRFSGFLINPIEVVSGLSNLANWIMDVVLDMKNNNKTLIPELSLTPESPLYNNACSIITEALFGTQKGGKLRFGIGPKSDGATRIQIYSLGDNREIYPNIFNLSSGESSLFCIFGELLRLADNLKINISLPEITGIVLIDEVDKHLHIKLQKEVLPKLFNLFPNIQFIVSSHSPFLSMGLAEELQDRSKIVDLDSGGISKDPTTNELYNEVYDLMVKENERFKNLYATLNEQIKSGNKPLIITEGKTDIQHLKVAMKRLKITDLDIEYFYGHEEGFGDSSLENLLENICKVKHNRKIIGIFDRDNEYILKTVGDHKDYGNKVYVFCIPEPLHRKEYKNISIEFYYTDEELKKEKDRKRMYFDNEVGFKQSASNKKDRTLVKLELANDKYEYTKKIFDEPNMCKNYDWIHSKSLFADLVEADLEFSKDFNFDNFKLIFDQIKSIITPK